MKLIVGLGNPGKEYEKTRHNIGFLFIDKLAKEFDVKMKKKKFDGLYEIVSYEGEKIIFLKPQTFMNLSGECIRRYIDFLNISIKDILIIHDDTSLQLGTFKFKTKGSSGGHNGLKNIEQQLQTKDYKRMKIGISSSKEIEKKDYVLGRFTKEENEIVNEIIELAPIIFKDHINLSFENLMNKYNKKI